MTDSAEPGGKRRHSLVEDFLSPHEIDGAKQPAVYVYEWPVRLWHWLNAAAIIVLMVRGYLIGSPPPSIGTGRQK